MFDEQFTHRIESEDGPPYPIAWTVTGLHLGMPVTQRFKLFKVGEMNVKKLCCKVQRNISE